MVQTTFKLGIASLFAVLGFILGAYICVVVDVSAKPMVMSVALLTAAVFAIMALLIVARLCDKFKFNRLVMSVIGITLFLLAIYGLNRFVSE